jgi:hypothetical protein
MPNMLSGAFDEDDDDSVVSPLRALGASLGDNLPHQIGNEQDSSVDENGWDFASHNPGDFVSERSGLLIVPADEHDDAVAAGSGERYEAAMALSVAGSDSFPSNMGSLHDLTGSTNAAACENPAQERLVYRDQEGEGRCSSYNRPISLLLLAMLVTSFLSSAFLFLERQSWQDTALRLEEKIRQLEEQQAQQAKGQEQAQQAKGKTEDPPPVFSWEKSGDAEDPEPTLFVDNCWLHAKANLELGKCANEAKKTAKKTFKESKKTLEDFGKTVVKENKRFWSKVDDAGKNFVEFMAESTKSESKSESVPVESNDNMNSSETVKITDARTKAITDTAKTIASGLVYASLAFVIVDESFAYFSGSPRVRPAATSSYF